MQYAIACLSLPRIGSQWASGHNSFTRLKGVGCENQIAPEKKLKVEREIANLESELCCLILIPVGRHDSEHSSPKEIQQNNHAPQDC